jgi:5-methylcytosine-specific restriction endonuclease McrA
MHRDPGARREWVKAYGKQRRADHVPFRVCELEGCDKLVDEWNRRVCQMHRKRLRRTGTYELRVPPEQLRTCVGCGVSFTSHQPAQVRCRKECGRGWKPVQRPPCRMCGGPISGTRNRLCSAECTKAAATAWVRANRPASERTSKTCRHCGTAFTGYDNALYCAPECTKRAAKTRRKARQHGAYIEDVWRAKVYERDGYVCQLCRKPIKRDAVVPHPKAGTLDHVLPLAVGGTHEYANVQTAHFMCNSVKGAGDAQLVLALDAYGEHHA